GADNSIEPISYAYTDYGVRNGDNYYRLVQVDYDGTSTASEIIVANCLGTDGEPEVLAYPNPFGDDLTLRFENFGNIQATVEVYDMLGRMVHTQKVNCSQNDYEVVLRLAGLSDGTYNVRISAKEFVLNRQVIKN
ncbi:MAG: T9SS type A sorting domain-containing protein, partial [Bacteroidales bacterium]|nr:T9SS type A sorting domain-containing protein [Bacteroidales bacterium]